MTTDKTGSMVERVATAICLCNSCDPDLAVPTGNVNTNTLAVSWTLYVPQARAAIAAMREPTEAMMEAGRDLGPSEALITGNEYRAMIDAALSEKTGGG